MTAVAAVRQSGRALAERRGTGLTDSLRQVWRNYVTYQRTLAELNALDVREREDIGLAGLDLEAVAKDAVYGRR